MHTGRSPLPQARQNRTRAERPTSPGPGSSAAVVEVGEDGPSVRSTTSIVTPAASATIEIGMSTVFARLAAEPASTSDWYPGGHEVPQPQACVDQ